MPDVGHAVAQRRAPQHEPAARDQLAAVPCPDDVAGRHRPQELGSQQAAFRSLQHGGAGGPGRDRLGEVQRHVVAGGDVHPDLRGLHRVVRLRDAKQLHALPGGQRDVGGQRGAGLAAARVGEGDADLHQPGAERAVDGLQRGLAGRVLARPCRHVAHGIDHPALGVVAPEHRVVDPGVAHVEADRQAGAQQRGGQVRVEGVQGVAVGVQAEREQVLRVGPEAVPERAGHQRGAVTAPGLDLSQLGQVHVHGFAQDIAGRQRLGIAVVDAGEGLDLAQVALAHAHGQNLAGRTTGARWRRFLRMTLASWRSPNRLMNSASAWTARWEALPSMSRVS